MLMIFLIFIFGLVVGSFLNAVIWRLYSGRPIANDRSVCPHCKHVLAAKDLVPLFSFVLWGGKCRYCHRKISWQYPAVELATAVSFLLLAQNYRFQISNLAIWFQLVFICFFIIIAVFDLKHYLILDKVLFPAILLAIAFKIYTTIDLGQSLVNFHSALIQGLVGACMLAGFFGLQFIVSNGRWIGFGDVKLGLLLGLIFGFGQGLMLLFLAYLSGAAIGLTLVLFGKKELSGKLPFGTFLAFCGIIMLLYGTNVLSWYLGLIGL